MIFNCHSNINKNAFTYLDIGKVQGYNYVLIKHHHNFITNPPIHVIYVSLKFQAISNHLQTGNIVKSNPSTLILIVRIIQIIY